MKHRYEDAYLRKWPDEEKVKKAKRSWVSEIAKMKPENVRKGILAVFNECPDYPPTLNKFLAECNKKDPHKINAAMYRPLPKLIQSTTREDRKATAQVWLKKIREKLL